MSIHFCDVTDPDVSQELFILVHIFYLMHPYVQNGAFVRAPLLILCKYSFRMRDGH